MEGGGATQVKKALAACVKLECHPKAGKYCKCIIFLVYTRL